MILDASVALKWVVAEPDSGEALRLMARTDLLAPTLLTTEVGYALTKLVRRRLMSQGQARTAWDVFRGAPVVLVNQAAEWQATFDLSLRLAASFYDCAYLALALAEDDVLVTADERFARSVRSAADLDGRVVTLADVSR